jgi:hypothetical protein
MPWGLDENVTPHSDSPRFVSRASNGRKRQATWMFEAPTTLDKSCLLLADLRLVELKAEHDDDLCSDLGGVR